MRRFLNLICVVSLVGCGLETKVEVANQETDDRQDQLMNDFKLASWVITLHAVEHGLYPVCVSLETLDSNIGNYLDKDEFLRTHIGYFPPNIMASNHMEEERREGAEYPRLREDYLLIDPYSPMRQPYFYATGLDQGTQWNYT